MDRVQALLIGMMKGGAMQAYTRVSGDAPALSPVYASTVLPTFLADVERGVI
jgi:hypothetical protein